MRLSGSLTADGRAKSHCHLPVMAITKMSIGVPPVNRFTGAATALRQCARTSDGR
jgi:hypothetical protein